MMRSWATSRLTSEADVLDVLVELRGKRSICRGHSRRYPGLIPSIDRDSPERPRVESLRLERRSIELFRATARYFAEEGEQLALRDDLVALMVLRHYGVPTRLLDWTMSPHMAAFFACHGHPGEDGEIWSFDHDRYAAEGKKQWEKHPETCVNGDPKQFDPRLTAFTTADPEYWFVCEFYDRGFPRQRAQDGLYSLTPDFGCDHADAIADLLADGASHHLYVIDALIKEPLLRALREEWGTWLGSLYPDSAGAAAVAGTVFETHKTSASLL